MIKINESVAELIVELQYAEEQLHLAEVRFDATTEPELIDAAIYEQMAWEKRCEFYNRKLKEAVAGGQAIQRKREYWRIME
jgi:hypothetical protein